MAAKVAFVVEGAWVAKIVRQPQLGCQLDSFSVSAARIWFTVLWTTFVRVNSSPNPHGLKKFCAIKFDGFRFHVEAFSRFVTGHQRAIIRDMRHNCDFSFGQKLRRRNKEPGNRRGDARESPGTYQCQDGRNLRCPQTPDGNSSNSADTKSSARPSPKRCRYLPVCR